MAGPVDGTAHGRDVMGEAGRGLDVDLEHGLDPMLPVRPERLLDQAAVERAPPVGGKAVDRHAQTFRRLAPAAGEHAGVGDQDRLARCDQVGECRLPGRVAQGHVGEHLARGLEDEAELIEAAARSWQ